MRIALLTKINKRFRVCSLSGARKALVLLCTVSAVHSANAQTVGQIKYDVDNKLKSFNGSTWDDIGVGTLFATCSEPGKIQWSAGDSAMEFCNGTNWVSMGATISVEACTEPGKLIYSSPNGMHRFCNGSFWVNTIDNPGYFVLTLSTYNGARTGLSGANATCLSELNTQTWMGKTSASARGLLSADTVQAFLCDGTSCNQAQPNTSYRMAYAGDDTKGGASIAIDSSGQGPGATGAWSGATYFGAAYTYWTGRGTGTSSTSWTSSPNSNHCNNWTSNSSFAYSGRTGDSSQTDDGRWSQTQVTCNNARRLLCMVHPADYYASAFSFTDQNPVSAVTLINSNIVQITGIIGAVPVTISGSNGPQYRICSDASCTTVTTNWTTSPGTIGNNSYVQLRVTSSGNPSTAYNTIFTVGNTSDTWTITTNSGIDNTPNAFSFTDLTNQATDTVVTSNIVQITAFSSADVSITGGDGLNREYRICADSSCTTVVADWNSGISAMVNNQYLQLRQTTYGPATSGSIIIQVGTVATTWTASTPLPGSVSGYMVLSSATYNGNRGGMAGAHATCLTEVTNNNWRGKADAQSRGFLVSDYVRAFLCDSNTCVNAVPSQTYTFAVAGTPASGGATFTTNASGYGPADSANWSGATYFGGNFTYWTGHGEFFGTSWSGTIGSTCSDWTNSGFSIGNYGTSNSTGVGRWNGSANLCSSSYRLLCIVQTADLVVNGFTFNDLTGLSGNTLTTSNIVQITGASANVIGSANASSGTPEFRVCSDAACGAVVTNWTQTATSIAPNNYVQLRITTPGNASATRNVTFCAGEVCDNWSLTNSAAIDSTPNAITFTNQTNQAVSTVISSNILQITGFASADVSLAAGDAASRQYRICQDAACSTVLTNWTSGTAAISNNQYIQLRQTSNGYGSTATTSSITVGTVTSSAWSVTTTSAGAIGYFVMMDYTHDGNLGGVAGADALCLTTLQNSNWVGKAGATLNSTKVKSFLCGASCNNLVASTTYRFAYAGNLSRGGATFTTNASGQGPGNADWWDSTTNFGVGNLYWSGRASSSNNLWATTPAAATCTNFTSNNSGQNGMQGDATWNDSDRWNSWSETCDWTADALICFVNP
jgi:hypothetical protein